MRTVAFIAGAMLATSALAQNLPHSPPNPALPSCGRNDALQANITYTCTDAYHATLANQAIANVLGLGSSGGTGAGAGPGISFGRLNSVVAGLSKQQSAFALGPVTYSSGVYIAAAGPLMPPVLAKGQVFSLNFPSATSGAAALKVGAFPTKSLALVTSSGDVLTFAGGEVLPGQTLVCYDGIEFILGCQPGMGLVYKISGATASTQSDWVYNSIWVATGALTLTLPCSSTLAQNGNVLVDAVAGAVVVNVTGGCVPSDNVEKNGTAGSSATVSQGTARAGITTDGAGHFYVSGS